MLMVKEVLGAIALVSLGFAIAAYAILRCIQVNLFNLAEPPVRVEPRPTAGERRQAAEFDRRLRRVERLVAVLDNGHRLAPGADPFDESGVFPNVGIIDEEAA